VNGTFRNQHNTEAISNFQLSIDVDGFLLILEVYLKHQLLCCLCLNKGSVIFLLMATVSGWVIFIHIHM